MTRTSQKTLAIIDDDTELLAELTTALGGSYHVTTSLGDPGTLRMLQDDPPSAIVLDLGVNGLGIVRSLGRPALLMYQELADMACHRITAGVTRAFLGEVVKVG